MTVPERLQAFIDYKQMTIRAFGDSVGFGNGTLGNFFSTSKGMRTDNLEKILHAYPELSAEWLLRGEGQMYRTDIDVHKNEPTGTEQPEEAPSKEVLLVPAGARGGSLEHFEAKGGMNPYNAEVIRSPFINADFAYPVKDDSMSPDYPAGTVLFVKRLVTSIIKWGNSYLFDTDDGFQFVKLRRSERGDDYVHCVPINTEDYETYDVPKVDIHGIYKVLGAMRW